MRIRHIFAAGSAVFALALAGSPAFAAPTSDKADAAAGWLTTRFATGDHLETDFGGTLYPDQGLTIDGVFALAGAGVGKDTAEKAMTWLAKPENLGFYAGDGTDEIYVGGVAKTLLAAEVQGKNPAAFGGLDLPALLLGLQDADGRFVTKSQYGDYSNMFTQALAVIALDRLPAGAPAKAVEFLAGQQCSDGGFPEKLAQQTCTSDPDATGAAIQALKAAGDDANAGEALTWLLAQQKADGGFVGGPGKVENANTTGWASQALRAMGKTTEADKANAFLLTLQIGCDGAADRRGSVSYDATGFVAGTQTRSTTGAMLGLGKVSLADLDGTHSSADIPTLNCDTLPKTGQSLTPIIAIGGGLVALGALVVVAMTLLRRRRVQG